LFYGVGGFRRNNFEVFSMCDGLLVGIWRIVLGINVKELVFRGGPHGFFRLGFIEFRAGMLVDFGVDSTVYLFGREIISDLFCEKRFLNTHLIY
jgi:hypothetical protein